MAASQQTLPQGFTVFQTQLGAPLQFIPALGTQELDDMVNMYIPGNAPLSDKRASVSVDFLEYAQVTGQAFKFYVVPGYAATSPAQSPATASLSASSINASPVTSSWDWSSVTGPSHPTVSRKPSSSAASSLRPAATPTDFSHLPGMKILTKDGLDVTNAASRGCKTKEQRDHAHLMRVIKACDSCRRKKVRCDPSHKRRAASATVSQPQQHVASGRVAKKARVSQEKTVDPALIAMSATESPLDMLAVSTTDTELDWDAFLNMPQTDSTWDIAATGDDFWNDKLIPHPGGEDDYNFFHDPQDVLSQSMFGQDSFATSASSTSSGLTGSLSPGLSSSSNDQSYALDMTDQWWSPTIEGDVRSSEEESQQSSLSASPTMGEEETYTLAASMTGSLVSLNVWSPDPGCAPLSSEPYGPRPQGSFVDSQQDSSLDSQQDSSIDSPHDQRAAALTESRVATTRSQQLTSDGITAAASSLQSSIMHSDSLEPPTTALGDASWDMPSMPVFTDTTSSIVDHVLQTIRNPSSSDMDSQVLGTAAFATPQDAVLHSIHSHGALLEPQGAEWAWRSQLPTTTDEQQQSLLSNSSGRSGGLLYCAAVAMMSATSIGSKKQPGTQRAAHGVMSGSLKSSLAAVVPIVAMLSIAATSWMS